MSKPKIGWIGTGIMGKSMCGHLLVRVNQCTIASMNILTEIDIRVQDAGYQVTVTNRTLSKCQDLVGKGARVVHSPAEVAQDAGKIYLLTLGFRHF